MRCLGVLSVREDTEKIRRRKIRVLEKERFVHEFPVVVAELSISREELERKKPWQKRRIFRKGKKVLKALGVDIIVPTVSCSLGLNIPAVDMMTVEKDISHEDMLEALELVLKEYQESPNGKTGWVADRECRPDCLSLLIAMSRKVQYLGVVTQAWEKAEGMADDLCREYGVDLEIQPILPWQERENTILADLDKGRILVDGTPVLEGRTLSLDLQGYRVDLPQLLKRYPELDEYLIPVGWCRRKSG